MVEYVKFETISLKNHSEIDEKWLQARIVDDPGILGLDGDVYVIDEERRQPKAGRLDLLLRERDTNRRYEVEIQLGQSDESHIIRTIEYWDIERKRYPLYDHCAVIIAEDITSRFLNVIGLFNGHIPIIAIQLTAFNDENRVGLIFTTVLDELNLGLVDDDEGREEVTNREYWMRPRTQDTVQLADLILEEIHTFAPGYELNYTQHYIGLRKDGRSNNFVSFTPKKKWMLLTINLPKTDEVDEILDNIGVDILTYDRQLKQYRVNINKDDIEDNLVTLSGLMKQAWELRGR